MKRALAFTLMVLAIMIIAVSCEEPHVHSFATEWTYDDTFHWHASACGHEEEVSDKEAHKWTEGGDEDGWIVDVESTEKEEGKKHRECSVCGYKEEGKVPLQGHVHTFSAYDHNGSKHWRTCTGCGEKFTYSHSLTYKYNANTHYQTCYCGYSTTETAHNFETSASDGSTLKTCTVCKYQETLTKQTETTTTVSEIVNKAASVTTITTTDGIVKRVNDNVKIAADVIATETTPTTAEGETAATTVSFPKGALKIKEGAEEVKLTVIAAPVTVASLNGSGYQITTKSEEATETTADTSKAVVAGFEFKLEGAVATDLKGTNDESEDTGKIVGTEITTWITPGLGSKDNLTIQYVGNKTSDDDTYLPTIKSYETSNGKLTFIVYHFSKYIILSTDKKIMDNKGNMYTGFADEDLATNLKDGSTLTLLADVNLSANMTFEKDITLNLNGKKVGLNSCTMSVESGSTITITDSASGGAPLITSGAKVASNSSAVNGTYYPSLEEAIENVQANSTIILLEDIDSLTKTIDINKTLTLDLGQKTVTTDKRVFLVHNGTLTIKNGTLQTTIAKQTDEDKIDSGKSVIRVDGTKGDVTINLEENAVINGVNCYGISAFGASSHTATLNIKGKITSANPCLAGDGENDSKDDVKDLTVNINVMDKAELTQDASKLNSTNHNVIDPVAIYKPNESGTLTISGGTITSEDGSAVEIRAGKAIISGGKLTSNAKEYSCSPNGHGSTVKGAAVAVSQHGTKKEINVTISGGTFSGIKQLAVVNPQNNNVEYTKNVKTTVKSGVEMDADKIVGVKTGGSTDVDGVYYVDAESAAEYDAISTWDGESVDTSWYVGHEKDDEFTLTSAAQLAGLSELVNNGTDGEKLSEKDKKKVIHTFSGKTIKLAVNINLNGKQWTPIGLYDPAGTYTDVDGTDGKELKLFSGTFDGQGHTINGLYFNDETKETVALFGYVEGTIKNFTVKGEITAVSAAGVVGGLEAGGKIDNVTSYVNITTVDTGEKAKAAGFVVATKRQAYANGNTKNEEKNVINNCKNYGNVTSTEGYASGFVGYEAHPTTSENCENHGTITGKQAGGFTGLGGRLTITNFTNKGDIKATEAAGGIIGHHDVNAGGAPCIFDNCRNEGKIEGAESKVGGLIGETDNNATENLKIYNNCSAGSDYKYIGNKDWNAIEKSTTP